MKDKPEGRTLIMVPIMGFPLVKPGFRAEKTLNSILHRKNCLPWSQFITVPSSVRGDCGADPLLSHTSVHQV